MIFPALRIQLRRILAHRLINRFLHLLFVNVAIYQIMIAVARFIPISRFTVNLALFTGITLFPIILLFGLHRGALRETLRHVDENCIIESYLEAEGEVRSYIEKRAVVLLEKKGAARSIPFSFRPAIRWTGLAAAGALILNFLITFMQFGTPALTYIKQQELQLSKEAVTLATDAGGPNIPEFSSDTSMSGDEDPFGADGDAPGNSVSGSQEKYASEGYEQVMQRLIDQLDIADEDELPPGTEPSDRIDSEREDLHAAAEEAGPYREGGEYSGGTNPAEGGMEGNEATRETDDGIRLQRAGKSLLDSPLIDYDKEIKKVLLDQSGDNIIHTESLSEKQKAELLNRLFSNFVPGSSLASAFSPDLENIGRRYLAAVRELLESEEK